MNTVGSPVKRALPKRLETNFDAYRKAPFFTLWRPHSVICVGLSLLFMAFFSFAMNATAHAQAPRVQDIVRQVPSPTNVDAIVWEVTFNEEVQGVGANDFTVTGLGFVTLNRTTIGSGASASYFITASGSNVTRANNTATIGFASGQNIQDTSGNALRNTTPLGANENTIVLDNQRPQAAVSGFPGTISGTFTTGFVFTEVMSGFSLDDILVTNGVASNLMNTGSSGVFPDRYSADITPDGSGDITMQVRANGATDAAGNGNAVSAVATTTFTPGVPDISVAGTTAFGNQDVVTVSANRVLTISNTGNGDLVLGTITLVGSDPGQFQLDQPADVTLIRGQTETFNVRFAPTSAGNHSALVNIPSNDPDDDPLQFLIAGTGQNTIPDMSVSGNALNITNGATATDVNNQTEFGSSDIGASAIMRSYVIRNAFASPDLTITGINLSGSSDFSLVTSSGDFTSFPVTIPANGTRTFTVQFNPSAPLGDKAAIVSIVSNDTDDNPFTFAVEGEATSSDSTAPRVTSIERQSPTASPTNADSVTWRVTFDEDVQNVDASDFSRSGTTATLAATQQSASIYDVTASGGDLAGLDGLVTLSFSGGQNIADVTAGNALVNTTPTGANVPTFLLDNTGSTPVISGAPTNNSAPFTVTFDFGEAVSGFTLGEITVGNGAASSFTGSDGDTRYTALITPATNGAVTIDVAANVATDIAGNNNSAAVQATSTFTTPVPEISVSSSEGGPVADGATDAQANLTEGTSRTVTYTVTNSGTADLTLIGTPTTSNLVNVNSPVTVSAPAALTVASGGGTTTFTVTYTPTAIGPFSFDLGIINDDADEGTYDIAISGTATSSDVTAPRVSTVTRQSPTVDGFTTLDSLIWRVIFDEDVQNVDMADFTVSNTTATITAVSQVSASTYDVTISGGDLAGLDATVTLAFAVGQNVLILLAMLWWMRLFPVRPPIWLIIRRRPLSLLSGKTRQVN